MCASFNNPNRNDEQQAEARNQRIKQLQTLSHKNRAFIKQIIDAEVKRLNQQKNTPFCFFYNTRAATQGKIAIIKATLAKLLEASENDVCLISTLLTKEVKITFQGEEITISLAKALCLKRSQAQRWLNDNDYSLYGTTQSFDNVTNKLVRNFLASPYTISEIKNKLQPAAENEANKNLLPPKLDESQYKGNSEDTKEEEEEESEAPQGRKVGEYITPGSPQLSSTSPFRLATINEHQRGTFPPLPPLNLENETEAKNKKSYISYAKNRYEAGTIAAIIKENLDRFNARANSCNFFRYETGESAAKADLIKNVFAALCDDTDAPTDLIKFFTKPYTVQNQQAQNETLSLAEALCIPTRLLTRCFNKIDTSATAFNLVFERLSITMDKENAAAAKQEIIAAMRQPQSLLSY